MFLKFAALIVSLGACACTLLALRQSRLQAAHELAEAQLRIRVHDERLWRLRSEIALRVTPAHVQLMAADLGPTHPLLPPTVPPLAFKIPGLELVPTSGTPGPGLPPPKAGLKPNAGAPKADATNPGAIKPSTTKPDAGKAKDSKPGRTPPKGPTRAESSQDGAPKATPKSEPKPTGSRRSRLADRGEPRD